MRPASPYALSKLAQEMVARHAGATTPVEVIVCRPFNHLGPRQSADYFAPNFARQIAAIARGQARAGAEGRQPHRAARPVRRPRHRPRLRRR